VNCDALSKDSARNSVAGYQYKIQDLFNIFAKERNLQAKDFAVYPQGYDSASFKGTYFDLLSNNKGIDTLKDFFAWLLSFHEE
jgi:hypothetical protein